MGALVAVGNDLMSEGAECFDLHGNHIPRLKVHWGRPEVTWPWWRACAKGTICSAHQNQAGRASKH